MSGDTSHQDAIRFEQAMIVLAKLDELVEKLGQPSPELERMAVALEAISQRAFVSAQPVACPACSGRGYSLANGEGDDPHRLQECFSCRGSRRL